MLLALALGVGSLVPAVFAETVTEPAWDPCALLSDTEVREVQGRTPIEKVRSEQQSGSFRLIQCFYRTADSTSSVSVALAVPILSDKPGSGPREYWQQRFHGQPAPVPGRKKKEPPQPQGGLGEEAFWVGDPVAGALYVLEGPVFLRLSPGGSSEASLKRERARTLAGHVLERLRGAPADDPQRAVPPE
jgi:hypothetical protein